MKYFFSILRWLSRGRVLNRIYELRTEPDQLLMEKNRNMYENLCEPGFALKLAYMADVAVLNKLNTSLQGKDLIISMRMKKIASFKK